MWFEYNAPAWYLIKTRCSLNDGAKNFHKVIRKSRYLPKKFGRVTDASISRNAFLAAPENILTAMVFDNRDCVRRLAVDRIVNARAREAISGDVRVSRGPPTNFDSVDYANMIDWI